MKKKYKSILVCLTILLIGCGKRNFFPDEDDPGLSRLTSRGYNVATMYINDVPYINPYKKPLFGIVNLGPTINLISTSSTYDTLNISWRIEINDSTNSYNDPYYSLSISMPVRKGFTAHDFLAMNGQRFASDSDAILLNSFNNAANALSGKANIYFINIAYTDSSATTSRSYAFSGLFNGNIGDSILITKGRFDFKIDANKVSF